MQTVFKTDTYTGSGSQRRFQGAFRGPSDL